MKRVLTALLLSSATLAAQAQDLLITNATVHTQSDRGVLENTDILIKDGVIQRVSSRIATNKMIKVIDAQGRPVTPALFAGVTVHGLSEVNAVNEAKDSEYEDLFTELMHPEFDVRPAYNPNTSVIPITRVEGFGYALLAATRGDRSISGQGGLVRFDGGYASFEGRSVIYVELSGQSAEKAGGSRAAHWMLLKQAFAELKADADDLSLLSPLGQEALASARKNGIFVFNANRAADIMQVLRFADAQRLKAVIHGGREAWMVADALAKAGIPVIINSLDNLPADFDSLGARLDNAALLHEAGVTVLFSSGETHNARKVRQLAGNAVANGLPHEVALGAMTTAAAEVFGGEARQIKAGNRADLVIWSGDPLEVTTLAEQVVIAGVADTMESRQSKLRDRYLPEQPTLPRAYINP